jgi:hypothetical protein
MDVMSNLLFFLLPLARRSCGVADDGAGAERRRELHRHRDGQGTVTCRSTAVHGELRERHDPEDQLMQYGAQIAKKAGNYDNPGLNAQLKRIKDRFPASKTVVMVPDDDIRYQVLVDIMDAARDWTGPNKQRTVRFPVGVCAGGRRRARRAPPAAPPAPAPAPLPAPAPPAGP